MMCDMWDISGESQLNYVYLIYLISFHFIYFKESLCHTNQASKVKKNKIYNGS